MSLPLIPRHRTMMMMVGASALAIGGFWLAHREEPGKAGSAVDPVVVHESVGSSPESVVRPSGEERASTDIAARPAVAPAHAVDPFAAVDTSRGCGGDLEQCPKADAGALGTFALPEGAHAHRDKAAAKLDPPPAPAREVTALRSFREPSPTSPLALQHQSREAQATQLNSRLDAHITELRARAVTASSSERREIEVALAAMEKNRDLRARAVRRADADRDLIAVRPSTAAR